VRRLCQAVLVSANWSATHQRSVSLANTYRSKTNPGMMSPPDLEPATNASGRRVWLNPSPIEARTIFTPCGDPAPSLCCIRCHRIHNQTKDRQALRP